MNRLTEFVVGSHYTNDQIRYTLSLENLGGIRPSIGQNGQLQHLALMTVAESAHKRKTENPYSDRIEGDILLYTASGKQGDQNLSGKNKRLLEQYERPLPFFGFVNEGKQTYKFLGLLELIRHYSEPQFDRSNTLRKVWVFEFKIHSQPEIVPLEYATTIATKTILESRLDNPIITAERNVVTGMQAFTPESNPQEVISNEGIRAKLLQINPYRFEHLLKAVVEKCGFVSVEVTRSSGDGGIDINAVVDESNDFFAGTLVQFQAKRWRHSVGSVEINNRRYRK